MEDSGIYLGTVVGAVEFWRTRPQQTILAKLMSPHLNSCLVSARVPVTSDPRSYYSNSIAGHPVPSKEIQTLFDFTQRRWGMRHVTCDRLAPQHLKRVH